jgi:hypothetical protein
MISSFVGRGDNAKLFQQVQQFFLSSAKAVSKR